MTLLTTAFDDLTILVDMDGVTCNWDKRFHAGIAHLADRLPADYNIRPSFDLFAGLDPDTESSVLTAMNEPGFYAELEPIDGAVEALHKMLELGLHIVIATSPWQTNPTCVDDKFRWLERHVGVGWGQRMVTTKDKTLIRGTILVDDKPRVSGKLSPEWEHVLFTQRYNVGLPGRRLDSWADWESALLTSGSVAA